MSDFVKGRPRPLTAGPGYMIRSVHKAMSRRLAAALDEQGIAFKHYYYLRALLEEDGITQVELSERVGMERATVTRVLDTMQRDGLVRRIRDPGDRRKINVYLTPRARRLRDPLVRTIERLNRATLTGITGADFARFERTLDRMIANCEGEAPAEAATGTQARPRVRRKAS